MENRGIKARKQEGREKNGSTQSIDRGNNTSKNRNNRNNRNNRKPIKRSNAIYRTLGLVLSALLLVSAILFSWALLVINLLPGTYVLIIMAVLCIIVGVIIANQALSRGRAILGKVVSVLLIVALGTGSFYIYETHKMLASISSNSGWKIDHMIVVVRTEDTAETIEDARDYNFGVQYALQAEDTKEVVEAIESELNSSIQLTELDHLSQQAEALLNNEVDALIYNEAYQGIIEEEDLEYESKVKIIFTYDIKTEMEEEVKDINITSDTFCVYISGIDVYGSISKNSRSDVNILVYVNPSTKQILLVNTPRDYYVTFPGITGSSKDKLTHAGIYGVDTSMKTLAQLYDTSVDYYARVNFTSLVTMVDALGGVNVYSEQSFTTSDGSLSVAKGYNSLNGTQALAFSRERYNVSGGDNQRGKNQQAVITAMIQKAISPAIISGATSILSSVSGNVDTDIPQSDIQALIKSQLSGGGSYNIQSMAATGTGDRQYCYSYSGNSLYVMQPNYSSIDQIKIAIQALQSGETLTDTMVAQ